MAEVMRVLCADDEPHALESLRQLGYVEDE